MPSIFLLLKIARDNTRHFQNHTKYYILILFDICQPVPTNKAIQQECAYIVGILHSLHSSIQNVQFSCRSHMKHFQYVSSLPLDPLVAKKKKKVVKASYYPFLLWKSLMVKRKLEHVYLQGCLVGEKSFQILNMTIEKMM